jgi:2-amino-4-hydroxy-6-hydroxymethyldihydropteridine diphosphokinase
LIPLAAHIQEQNMPSTPDPSGENKYNIAYIALGSNLGERMGYLRLARTELESSGVQVVQSSPLYATAPVGGPAHQEDYYNAVLKVLVACPPEKLLHICQQAEGKAGRKRLERWGPRTLDVDILLYADLIILKPELQIPHPRMSVRRFVLEPLAALAPELVVPGEDKSVADLLEQLPETPRVCKVADTW